jgi:hypothetical protein
MMRGLFPERGRRIEAEVNRWGRWAGHAQTLTMKRACEGGRAVSGRAVIGAAMTRRVRRTIMVLNNPVAGRIVFPRL